MDICSRCKINKADKRCEKCREKYCKLCDYYVHEVMNEDIHNNNKLKKTIVNSTKKKGTNKEIHKPNKTITDEIKNKINKKNNYNNFQF